MNVWAFCGYVIAFWFSTLATVVCVGEMLGFRKFGPIEWEFREPPDPMRLAVIASLAMTAIATIVLTMLGSK